VDFRSIILKFVDEFTIGQEAAAYRAELVRQAKKRAAAEALLSIETPEHPIPLERLDELKNDGLFATDDDMTTLESRKITCPDGSIVEVKTSRAVLQILDELTDTEQKHDRKHDRKKFLAPSNLRGGESGNNITPKEYIEAKMSRTFTASDRGSVLRIIKDREHSERLEITREFHYRWHREIKARLHELLSETQAKYYYEYQYNGCKYYKRIGDLYGVSLQAVKKVLTAEKFVARISANRLYKIEPSAELFSWYETEIAKLHTAETYSEFEALIKKIIANSKK